MISRKPDRRFLLHRAQPRAKYLTPKLRQLCKVDPAFLVELQGRVSVPARWEAFVAGLSHFSGKECARCGSTRRRVVNGACYDCMLARNRGDFELIRRRIMPPAGHTLAGLRDIQDRKRRERKGEVRHYQEGDWRAEKFPTGRVRLVSARRGWDMDDLAAGIGAKRLFDMATTDRDLAALLVRLGWIDSATPYTHPDAAAPQLPPWLTGMEVRPDPAVLAGHALGGPVFVAVRRSNGSHLVKAMHCLEREEADALCRFFWEHVPPCIKALAEAPAEAYLRYQSSKLRGYIRG